MRTEDRATRSSGAIPEWGIDPVPPDLRRFSALDNGVLWFNLGISLLLPIVAAFLVPGLSFRAAVAATIVGVVIGNTMLGYAGRIGAATGAPGMVLYRPSLGMRGSYGPTVLNVLQNIGWGAFELLIIGTASAAISKRAFGAGLRPMWTIAFGFVVTVMAVGGPLIVVPRWIRRYAVWLVLASSIYLTVYVLTTVPFSTFTGAHGNGSTSFWQGVDLVVAMPISWIPLVADYSRFSRSRRGGGLGTGIGYAVAHFWFYVLGILLILSHVATTPDDPTRFVNAVLALPIGVFALGILAIDETKEAFANVYSASVSVQNAFPKLGQRRLSAVVGVVCTALAVAVPLVQYQNFLLLLGAVFVPLFGVLVAHYAVVMRGYTTDALYGDMPGVRFWGIIAWLAGFLAYNWLNPGTVSWWQSSMHRLFTSVLHAPKPVDWLSASIVSFVIAFAVESAQAAIRGARRSAV